MDRPILITAYTALLLLLAVLLFASVRRSRVPRGWVRGYNYFLANYAFYFVFVPLVGLVTNTYSRYAKGDPIQMFYPMLFCTLAFLLTFLAGYTAFPARSGGESAGGKSLPLRTPTGSHRYSKTADHMVLFLVAVVFVVSFRGFFAEGLLFYLANIHNRILLGLGRGYYLWGLTMSVPAGYVFLDRYLREGDTQRRALWIGATLLVIGVLTLIILGLRGRALGIVLLIVLLYGARRPMPIRTVAIAAVALLPVGIGLGYLRSNLSSALEGASGSAVMQQVRQSDFGQSLLLNFGIVSSFGVLMENYDGREFKYGSTLLALVTMPVPRAVYPEKPSGSGPEASNIISPGTYRMGRSGSTGFTISLLGEGYMNFGYAGVVLLGMLYGIAVRLADRRLQGTIAQRPPEPRLLVWLIFSIGLTSTVLIGEFVGAMMGILMNVVPIWVLIALLERPGVASQTGATVPKRGIAGAQSGGRGMSPATRAR
jgi:hypothetical protein